MKKFEFVWEKAGKNGEHIVWVINAYGQKAQVHYVNEGWSGWVNGSCKAHIETETEAKEFCERALKHDIKNIMEYAEKMGAIFSQAAWDFVNTTELPETF